MSAVAGLRATGDFGTDERPKNFREMILFRNPTGKAPIFALTSRGKKKSVNDPEFSWWDEPMGHIRLQVNGALGASDTVVTVDSPDPSATSPHLQWGLATHLKPGDILQVETTETADYNLEHVLVTAVISSTQFMVERGVAGSTAASISDNSWLTLIGSAYAEGTPAPAATTRNPIKYYNYTQIFKNTYELSGTADQTKFRTGSPWSNDKRRKTWDHSRDIEMAFLFGRRYETTGANGKPLRFMGGLREFIPTNRTTIFGAAMTVNSFLDAVYPVFDFETGAGDERIAFCGNTALNEFNKIVQSDSNSEIHYMGPVKVFGLEFQQMNLPQGRIFLRTHPLLNQHSKFSSSMFILDFDSIRYVPLQNRDTKVKDDVQTQDEDVRRGFLQTECSLMVDRGGLTQAYLGQISST